MATKKLPQSPVAHDYRIVLPYSPVFPEWRVALQTGYPTPNKFPIRDVLLVACGINPENCGHKTNDPDFYMSAVGWKSAGMPTEYLAPKAFQKKTFPKPGRSDVKHSPMIYTRISGLVPEYSRMVEWAIEKYGEPLTDQVAGIDVLQGLKAAGFKVHEWLEPLVSHVPVVTPVVISSVNWADPGLYLPTTEFAEKLHRLFQEDDFGYLSGMTVEKLQKLLASGNRGKWMDLTKDEKFKSDDRRAPVFIKGKPGRSGKPADSGNQSRRHAYWTLLAIARRRRDRSKVIGAFRRLLPGLDGSRGRTDVSSIVYEMIHKEWFPPEGRTPSYRQNWLRWFLIRITGY